MNPTIGLTVLPHALDVLFTLELPCDTVWVQFYHQTSKAALNSERNYYVKNPASEFITTKLQLQLHF